MPVPEQNRRRFLQASLGAGLLGTASHAGSLAAFAAEQPPSVAAAKPNAEIERLRGTALDLLKPSERDLQHGLELHSASLVFDCYGFAPRASLDAAAIDTLQEAGASDRELDDLREEMSMTRCITDPAEQAEFKEAWRASGVTCIFQNAGEEGQHPLRLLKRLARFTHVTDMLRDFVFKAATPEDILTAKRRDQHCFYLTGNGVPLPQEWSTVEEELGYLRVFHQLGIRMMHVTYNRRNMLGDGCAERANGGLSDFGRTAVAEMNRVGVIPDVAHSGWRTSFETATVSTRPVVASHTTCAALHEHIRSKPDDVIKAIADSGGLVGICCISDFLGAQGNIHAFLDHIDHVARSVGVDHVGIGTDVGYASRVRQTTLPPQAARPKTPRRTRFEALWHAGALGSIPQHPSISWTNWPLFTVGLVQRGYKDDDIQKIIGGNMLRVARETSTRKS